MLLNCWKTVQYNCIVIIVNILACLVNRYTVRHPWHVGAKLGLVLHCCRYMQS